MGTAQNLSRFLPLLEASTHHFLLRLLKQPDDFLQHIRNEVAALVLKLAYGYTVADNETDPLVELINLVHRQIGIAAQPGAWMVDMFPACQCRVNLFPDGRD